MPSALRPDAPDWYPGPAHYNLSPLNQGAPINHATQPFASQPSFAPQHFVSKAFASEPFASAEPFASQPFTTQHPGPEPLYVYHQVLGTYSGNDFYPSEVQYHYSRLPPSPPPPPAYQQWTVAQGRWSGPGDYGYKDKTAKKKKKKIKRGKSGKNGKRNGSDGKNEREQKENRIDKGGSEVASSGGGGA